MIYGQYAKQYAKNNTYKVVSESDSIIEYLINEQDNYKSILLNESYIDDNERLVMEAKLEVLNEIATGAIIAAIIALLTALAALLVKVVSMMKQGGSKVKENIKKASEKMKNTNEDDKNKQDNTSQSTIINNKDDTKKNTDKSANYTTSSISSVSNNQKNKPSENAQKPKETDRDADGVTFLVKRLVKEKNIKELKYVFLDCLDVDPTFKKFKDDFIYVKNAGLFEKHEELTPFFKDQSKWNIGYYNKLKSDFNKNPSAERISFMSDVAYYKTHSEKVERLNKERGEKDLRKRATTGVTYQYSDVETLSKNLINKVSKDFENGIVDTASKWFKLIIPSIEKDLNDFNTDDLQGLSLYDFSSVVNEKGIENCIILLKAASGEGGDLDDKEIEKAGWNPEYIKNREKYGIKQGKIDQTRKLKQYVDHEQTQYSTIMLNMNYNNRTGDPVKDIVNLYNKTSEKSAKFVAENYKKFLDSGIDKRAEKVQNKLNSDIKKFEQVLKSVKENDYGQSEFINNKSKSEKVTKYEYNDWVEDVLYIEKNAVKFFQRFVEKWQQVEIFRLRYINEFTKSFTKNFKQACSNSITDYS